MLHIREQTWKVLLGKFSLHLSLPKHMTWHAAQFVGSCCRARGQATCAIPRACPQERRPVKLCPDASCIVSTGDPHTNSESAMQLTATSTHQCVLEPSGKIFRWSMLILNVLTWAWCGQRLNRCLFFWHSYGFQPSRCKKLHIGGWFRVLLLFKMKEWNDNIVQILFCEKKRVKFKDEYFEGITVWYFFSSMSKSFFCTMDEHKGKGNRYSLQT